MNVEDIREYCLKKSDVTEGFPFGGDTLVFKVKGKVFLLIGLDSEPLQFNVKCKPDKAIELREQYPEEIIPGYHMNKKHWNSIFPKGLKSNFVKNMIDDSYDLVKK
ncbi:MAG: MmcQ/YjbR family DNA-binding protein [Ferruginibacter sp.]|nr:MmcQ/YjbR family DNA-binding protein [Ferruginibacter sp.]